MLQGCNFHLMLIISILMWFSHGVTWGATRFTSSRSLQTLSSLTAWWYKHRLSCSKARCKPHSALNDLYLKDFLMSLTYVAVQCNSFSVVMAITPTVTCSHSLEAAICQKQAPGEQRGQQPAKLLSPGWLTADIYWSILMSAPGMEINVFACVDSLILFFDFIVPSEWNLVSDTDLELKNIHTVGHFCD